MSAEAARHGDSESGGARVTPDLLFALEHCGYDPFRRWCRDRVWPGCGHGSELRREHHDDGADQLLLAAEGAGWIRRGSYQRTPEQYLFAHPGGHTASPRPCEWHWEPNRDGDFYGELIAFVALEPMLFWQIMGTTRRAVEVADRAERKAQWSASQAADARKSRETAKRRAFAMRGELARFRYEARYLVTQLLDSERAHAVAQVESYWGWQPEGGV